MNIFSRKFQNPKLIYLILFFILTLGLFFRTYKLDIFYTFNHDQDLYSWIVKDILVDHHFRLIGQLTSIEGVFIGPLFYYLLVPFFALTNLDPIGANILTTIIGLATVFSLYFVISRFFSQKAGIIAAFLYAVSWPNAFFDRWVVPTEPTIIWSVWLLYSLFLLNKGNPKAWVLLGILFGLIWHIHVALLPLILLVPLVFLLSGKRYSLKVFFLPAIIFFLLTMPFWAFEIRHNFQQTLSLLSAVSQNKGTGEGLFRLSKVINASGGALSGNMFYRVDIPSTVGFLVWGILFFFLMVKKILTGRQQLILLGWLFLSLASQFISKRPISEYYFANLTATFFLLFSLVLTYFLNYKKTKYLVWAFLVFFLIRNIVALVDLPNALDGYAEKKRAIEYIQNDALARGFSCVGINYITDYGNGVGFYYLLWLKDLNPVKPGEGVPIYNIVIPWTNSSKDINSTFGTIGVILPPHDVLYNPQKCQDKNNQLELPLGFTK